MRTQQTIVRDLDNSERTRPFWQRMMEESIEVTFSTAGVEVEIPHSLGKIPSDIIVGIPYGIKGITSTAATIYRGSKTWTTIAIYLKASAACSVKVYLVP